MKISVKQYANSLFEATKEKRDRASLDQALSNFFKILVKNNSVKLFPKISQKFSEIYNKNEGVVEAEVLSKNKLGEDFLNEIKSFVKKKYAAQEVVLKPVIDENILGGIIIKVGGEILDASFSRQLLELKNKLIND